MLGDVAHGAAPVGPVDPGLSPPKAHASLRQFDPVTQGELRFRRRLRPRSLDHLAPQLLRRGQDVVELILDYRMRDGVLHLMAKRNEVAAVKWLLDHGANPNALWDHWDSRLTPLHLATLGGHAEIARVLLAGGADPHIHDSKHDSSPIGWATFFGHEEFARLLETSATSGS